MDKKSLNIKAKHILLGTKSRKGLLGCMTNYVFLAGIGFLFLYPVFYMIINSFMGPEDIVDPAVSLIPSKLFFGNYIRAFRTLDFFPAFSRSVLMSVVPAFLSTASCAVIGYGLARFKFPLKNLWLVLIVATFFIPSQVTLIPRYLLFSNYDLINTPWTQFLPAAFGQGIKSSLFILIFMQFFASLPLALYEAAEIDGAGRLKVFASVALPLAKPAVVISSLFSLVWYWNETTQSSLFFGKNIKTLPMMLGNFVSSYSTIFAGSATEADNALNEAISLTGTFLSILPILILYFILQKQFVESIEKAGITGE